MFSALSNTTKWLIIAGFLLVLAIGVAVVLYFSGKASGKRSSTINLSDPTGPDGSAPTASTAEISQLAGKLYRDMDGANFFGHDIQAWRDLLAMSDADFIRIYNEFDTQYQKSSGQSLVQWVDSEVTGLDEWSVIKPTVQQRFNKLKLI